jgi:outer membrane immunogenic protein
MPYVTGGGGLGTLRGSEAGYAGTATVGGWTVGAGIEAKLWPNLSVKLEYLHVDLGNNVIFSEPMFGPPFFGTTFAESIRFTTEIFRAGLNYRF